MYISNKKYAETASLFCKACSLAGTETTPRQAAKFRAGRGKAFKFRNEASRQLLDESKKADEEKAKAVEANKPAELPPITLEEVNASEVKSAPAELSAMEQVAEHN